MSWLRSVNNSPGLSMASYIRGNSQLVNQSLDRLSSGLRVKNPAEDASAYFLANDLGIRQRSTQNVANELEDNIQGLKTGIDALNEVKGLLEKASELANRASNSTDDNLRETLAGEYDNLMTQIGNVVSGFSFNGTNLLNSQQTITLQIDEEATNTLSYTLYDTRVSQLNGLNLGTGSGAGDDYDTATTVATGFGGTGAGDAAEQAAAANFYKAINGTRDDDGEASGLIKLERNISRMANTLLLLEGRQSTLQNKAANYEAAQSALIGVNEAEETTRLTSAQMRQQAGAYYLAQSNAHYSNVQRLLFGM